MKDTVIPTGLKLTPMDDEFREDPYPILQQLREEQPVHRDQELNRYVITEYDIVKKILRSADHSANPRKSKPDSFSRFFLNDDDDISMLFMDEPEHRRMRDLVNDIFTPKAIQPWRVRIAEVIEHHLDLINENEFDLIREFAGPVPTVIIAEMMGIASDNHEQFKRWSEASNKTAFNPSPSTSDLEAAHLARLALNKFFAKEIAARRAKPSTDIISKMLSAEVAGEKLTDAEIINQCNLLLAAGNVTTTDLIGNGIKALLEHPKQLKLLLQNPHLIEAAVEEVLRYDSPVINGHRVSGNAVEYSGCPIGKGECLHVSLGAANRDPAVYEKPNQFLIERARISHQSFGGGKHHCLGASLARLEAQEAILRIFKRFPNLRLSDRGARQAAVPGFRGMEYCWLCQ